MCVLGNTVSCAQGGWSRPGPLLLLWSSPTDRLSKLLKEADSGVLPPRVSVGPEMGHFLQEPSKCRGGLEPLGWELPGPGTSPPGPRRTVLKACARPPTRVPGGVGREPRGPDDKPPEDSGWGCGSQRSRAIPPWPLPPPLHLSPLLPSFPPQTRLKSISSGPDAACTEAGLCPSREPPSGAGSRQAGWTQC